MSRLAPPLVLTRIAVIGLLTAPFATPALAGVNDLFVTSDVSNVVSRYAGNTGAFQTTFTPSNAATGQLGIHFGATNNRVLVGHFSGGVEEFNATTGAYIKTYNAGGGTQWTGIYAPNGNVYIGDWSTNDVREYNSTTGAFVQVLTPVCGPADMRIGPNGNLYICSFMCGFVMEVNATTGAFVSLWNQPPGARTNDIAFNPNGEILVTDMATNDVHRYDSAHNLLGSFAGTGWGRPHGIEFSPWTGNVLVVDGVTAQVHEFDPTTYAELNPAFLAPPPGGKIVDLAFHGEVVYVNKDLLNNTGQMADDVEILLEGSFTSTVSLFMGGFPNFTITPVGPNTQFRWSGLATPNGTVRHVGFGVEASEVKILGVSWTLGGTVIGCAPQVNTLYGTHSGGTGVLVYDNSVVDCVPQILHAGNLQIEYYDLNVPDLAEMVVGGVRNPLRVDSVPGVVTIPVNDTVEVPGAPAPPAAARYSLLVFDVGTDLGLTDATGDFLLTPIGRNVPEEGPMSSFCFPNFAGTRSCPCGNQPVPNDATRGCNNFGRTPPSSGDPATATGGAILTASGTVASSTSNTLVFHVTGQHPTPSGNITILFVGSTALSPGVISGAGVRCVGGLLVPRPYKGQSVFDGGSPGSCSIDFPNGSLPPPYNQDAWTRSGNPAGVTRHYYAAYRNTAAGNNHAPCAPATAFNLTNAGSIFWP